ncbi:MAG TPA: UDP-N-acetylglucosamine 2-epimerase (non-hydrolyzing) [Saprospiraceae bacterium]|nr:UDP-N-acetylglucosamine 2-epimerase (non-hydrolyzing) [Saprospiraceae bacterium]HMP22658.1 UDP-N-acetylglucosamine 2-epimerase (non-hydrolyzing) [Saprospiraceae bacterium]
MKKILLIIGTRPEAIKMAPVLRALRAVGMQVHICDTGQHRSLKQPILDFFDIQPNYQLNAIESSASLSALTAYLLQNIAAVLKAYRPEWLLVQGDTTSALAGALAGFYEQIPVGHIEAGLRTGDMAAPFPEEANRQLITRLAYLHFAPTAAARENLLRESIPDQQICVVGNTVVDALHYTLQKIALAPPPAVLALQEKLDTFRQRYAKMIVLTLHRRENLRDHQQAIGEAIRTVLQKANCFVLWPLHANPAVQTWAHALAADQPGLLLVEALPYEAFVWAMQSCDLILTDSGGIQEEAPSLGKQVIVLRTHTERTEAQAAGIVREVSIESTAIVMAAVQCLERSFTPSALHNPFGDGAAAQRIAEQIKAQQHWP